MAILTPDPTIRRQVMSAATELLDQDPDAPIARIARAAGVSRATFYRHFRSRANLLASVAHEPRPEARERILAAAEEMLVRTSLDDLSMDALARAAGVSRGTLYRVVPGKAALLRALLEAYSPFEAIRRIVSERCDDPPEVVLPLVARELVGVAEVRMGLVRTVFHEATLGSDTAIEGVRPFLVPAIGALTGYVAGQVAAGRIRPMPPLLALQAFVGPIFFHLLTRPAIEELGVAPPAVTSREAVDALVQVALAALRP